MVLGDVGQQASNLHNNSCESFSSSICSIQKSIVSLQLKVLAKVLSCFWGIDVGGCEYPFREGQAMSFDQLDHLSPKN